MTDQQCEPSEALKNMGRALRDEFAKYAARKEPTENPLYATDLNHRFGPQEMAVRMGYRIIPHGKRAYSGSYACPPTPDLKWIRSAWTGNGLNAGITTFLGWSNMLAIEILDRKSLVGFSRLAQLEDTFGGRCPRSRIVETPLGYQLHMRGRLREPPGGLGAGLLVTDGPTLLPHSVTDQGRYRWLCVGDLENAPPWVLEDAPLKGSEHAR